MSDSNVPPSVYVAGGKGEPGRNARLALLRSDLAAFRRAREELQARRVPIGLASRWQLALRALVGFLIGAAAGAVIAWAVAPALFGVV